MALVAALWLASSTARADNTADEAQIAFSLGNRAYAQRDYEEALRSYFLSYRLVPNRNVLFNIARCYEALQTYNEAYRYYSDLLALALPAADQKEVTGALARIRPRVALIRIVTEPEGADIYVDREDLGSRGQSPLTLALAPGKHQLHARKEGFRDAQGSAVLATGKQVDQALSLEALLGTVELSGAPAGAWVRELATGPDLGVLPARLRLPPGRRILYVGAPGHVTTQVLVDVKAEETSLAQAVLPPVPVPSGKVVVTANRQNAVIRVDGRESGFTPTVLTLPEGEHEVTFSLPELREVRQKVTVARDQEQSLHVELHYEPPPVKAASKSLVSVDEAPASVTVITQEEIRSFGYTTLAEALAAVRGVFLTDDRQYVYLGIRGFSPPGDLNTRVLILYDGHALNDVWAGQGYAGRDFDVDLEEVDRIEVVRGPGSVLYGTGAFFAVINVVPRNRVDPPRNVEATLAAGGLGSWRAHLTGSAGDLAEGRGVIASASGYRATGAESTDLGPLGLVRGLDGERAYHAAVRARLSDFSLAAQVNHREKDLPTAPFGTQVGVEGTRLLDQRGFAELRYEHAFSAASVSARAYYDGSRYQGRWAYDANDGEGGTRYADDAGRADWLGMEARVEVPLPFRNLLTAGVEGQLHLRVEQEILGFGASRPVDSRSRTLLSAYLLDEWRPLPAIHLSAGLRVDRYLDLDVVPVTPRVALILKPYEGGLTKLVAGSAFRAPNLYELYYDDGMETQRSSPNLRPETITTFELEHSHDLSRELRLTVAGYHNRISDLVVLEELDETPPQCGGGAVQCIQNLNSTELIRAFGVEAELRWQPGRFALVDLSFSYVNLITGSEELQTLPALIASGRLMLPLADNALRLSTEAVFQSARGPSTLAERYGEVLLINVGLSGDLPHLRYFAGVTNLLDSRYLLPTSSDASSLPVPQYGRSFLIQLTASY